MVYLGSIHERLDKETVQRLIDAPINLFYIYIYMSLCVCVWSMRKFTTWWHHLFHEMKHNIFQVHVISKEHIILKEQYLRCSQRFYLDPLSCGSTKASVLWFPAAIRLRPICRFLEGDRRARRCPYRLRASHHQSLIRGKWTGQVPSCLGRVFGVPCTYIIYSTTLEER